MIDPSKCTLLACLSFDGPPIPFVHDIKEPGNSNVEVEFREEDAELCSFCTQAMLVRLILFEFPCMGNAFDLEKRLLAS